MSFLLSKLRLPRDKVLCLLLKVRPPTINFNIWGRGEGAVEGKGAGKIYKQIWVKLKGASNELSKVTKSFFHPSFQPSFLLIYHFSLHQ